MKGMGSRSLPRSGEALDRFLDSISPVWSKCVTLSEELPEPTEKSYNITIRKHGGWLCDEGIGDAEDEKK